MASVLYRKWSWNLNIQKSNVNQSNVKTVVWDDDSSTSIISTLTDASGNISEQIITESIYTITNVTTISTDSKTPHVISCVKYGLTPFSLNINFVDKRNDTFYMTDNIYLTETDKSLVSAYTGISINHTTDNIDLTTNHTINELYDYSQNEAYDSPQKDFPIGIIKTSDGINYISYYSIDFSLGIFDGLSNNIQVPSFSLTDGSLKDINIIGNGDISSTSVTSFTNLTINGTLNFSISGEFTFDGGGIDTVTNTSGGNVIIHLSNGSSINTNTGPNITIIKDVDLVIGGLRENTEVRIYKKSDGTILDGIENVTETDFVKNSVQYYKFTYTFNATVLEGIEIEVAVYNIQYIPIFGNYTLTSTYVYWPFTQQYDRNYKNP
jgi:hypothetical protein